MVVKIKGINNGWLVHYEVFRSENTGYCEMSIIKDYETEKAFTYDFDHEAQDTWSKLSIFIKEQFYIPEKKNK